MSVGDSMVFLYITTVFLALTGLICIIGRVYTAFYRCKTPAVRRVLLLTIDNSDGDTVYETKLALAHLSWLDRSEFDRIAAVNCGLSEKDLAEVRDLLVQNDVKMIRKEDIGSIFDYG